MSHRISIPEGSRANMVLVAEHASALPLLIESSNAVEPAKRTRKTVAREFASRSGLPGGVALAIVSQILTFLNLREHFSMTAAELFEALSDLIKSDEDGSFSAEVIEKWKKSRVEIENAMDSNSPMHVMQKSYQLAFEHPNTVHVSKIITDIRPVFDDSASEVRKYVVHHTLHIDYYDGNRHQTQFFTLDASDIATLKRACERAETKAITLKRAMADLSLDVMIWGEFQDD